MQMNEMTRYPWLGDQLFDEMTDRILDSNGEADEAFQLSQAARPFAIWHNLQALTPFCSVNYQ